MSIKYSYSIGLLGSLAGLLGLEPRMTESKSAVLPLHHNPTVLLGRSTKIRTLDSLVPNQMRYQAALYSELVAGSGIAPETRAYETLEILLLQPAIDWWRMSDSNRPPTACKAAALPDELIPHNTGAEYRVRTDDLDVGNVALYQLS